MQTRSVHRRSGRLLDRMRPRYALLLEGHSLNTKIRAKTIADQKGENRGSTGDSSHGIENVDNHTNLLPNWHFSNRNYPTPYISALAAVKAEFRVLVLRSD